MRALAGITWEHARGLRPLVAACDELAAVGIDVAWDARPLREFEQVPLSELATSYDLLAIDHPFVGLAAATDCLVALEHLLPTEFLAEIAADSVGPSAACYRWAGMTWALPMDAAAQVSAYRPDLIDGPPRTWDKALGLMSGMPSVVAANPVHLWSAFVSASHQQATGRGPVIDYPYPWWDQTGFDASVCVAALERLADVLDHADPVSFDLDPIGVLDLMAAGRGPVYSPLVFGYSNYARSGYARHRIAFAPAPAEHNGGHGTMLGGVGLAVSRHCSQPQAAARVLEHVLDATCQSGTYVNVGGQPGRRSAWTSPAVNDLCPDFFAATLATLEHALVRPRVPGYPRFQHLAATILHDGLRSARSAGSLVPEISCLWRETVRA